MTATPEHPVTSVAGPHEQLGSPIESFELTMKLDCTLTVNGTDWFKPGVSGAIKWKRLPSEEELKLGSTYIQEAVIGPAIADAINHMSARLEEARRRH